MSLRWPVIFALFLFGVSQLDAQGKMSLGAVKEAIQAQKRGVIPEVQTITVIQTRGVDFLATEDNLAELVQAGATLAILNTIRRIAPAPVPTGSIEIRCAPTECDIAINGRPAGKSANGRFRAAGIAVGEIVVDIGRDGYIGQQIRMKVGAGPAPAEATVTLAPTPNTVAAMGKRTAEAMLNALGADARTTEITKLSGNGAATAFLGDKQSEWMFNVEVVNNMMAMRAAAQAGTLEFTCTGQVCMAAKNKLFARLKGGKAPPAAISEELQVDLRAFSRFNFVAILQTLIAPSVKFTAPADNSGESHLLADVGDLTYDFALGSDMRPVAVTYASETGLGSGLKVTFGQYRPLSNGLQYPLRTAIRLADAAKHGIEVRFDKVESPDVPKN